MVSFDTLPRFGIEHYLTIYLVQAILEGFGAVILLILYYYNSLGWLAINQIVFIFSSDERL